MNAHMPQYVFIFCLPNIIVVWQQKAIIIPTITINPTFLFFMKLAMTIKINLTVNFHWFIAKGEHIFCHPLSLLQCSITCSNATGT